MPTPDSSAASTRSTNGRDARHSTESSGPHDRPLVLLCTSNGVGLGHVTRMMAVAESLQGDASSVMFTLSAALSIPVDAGMVVEHLPSARQYGASARDWHRLLSDRLDRLVGAYRPGAVLFDGVHPYHGLRDALRRHRRHLTSVWVRRGTWKRDLATDADALAEMARPFDLVVEPGDYATSYDRGITARHRAGVHVVSPIVYSPPGPRPDRDQACAELGLRTSDTNVLVQLGAGRINDTTSAVGAVTSTFNRYPGAAVAVARSVLSAPTPTPTAGATEVRHFPITHFAAAFDVAVVAAGYNSFHEMLSMGVPTIIVPNLDTRTDDQDARSRWAHDHGYGFRWDGTSTADLDEAVEAIMDPDERSRIRQRLAGLPPAAGARETADLVLRRLG